MNLKREELKRHETQNSGTYSGKSTIINGKKYMNLKGED